MSAGTLVDQGNARASREEAWEERLAEVRGVHSIRPSMAGVRRYSTLFSRRRVGKLTAPNSIKYAACSVSNFNNPDGSITEREFSRMEVVARTGCVFAGAKTLRERQQMMVGVGVASLACFYDA